MFSKAQNLKRRDPNTKTLLAKLSDAKKYQKDSNHPEISTKSYSDQISKKLLIKVEASLS